MFKVTKDFIGGNIEVLEVCNDEVILRNEQRDTEIDWFYWAFCVEGAAGRTIRFKFAEDNRLGYFGVAVSRDLENWSWTGSGGADESFTYTFGADENKLFFAHHMLYHPKRFFDFAKDKGLVMDTLCVSQKGNAVPCCSFGRGDKKVILSARHHCCESTGSYVLEGVISELLENPIEGHEFFCVPFVDYEGVLAGDQGKARRPHDHNRDYGKEQKAIYRETAAIRSYALQNEVAFALDFHSPWHKGGKDDLCFIVQSNETKLDSLIQFGKLFEENITENAFAYRQENDIAPDSSWNRSDLPLFANFMSTFPENEFSFTLEMPYFGVEDNSFSMDRAVETGRSLARALHTYIMKN